MAATNVALEAQTTKKFDLPISHLDYNYIDSCSNSKELEKIVLVLRSGEEGKFPDLERHAEERLEKIKPKSRILRKDGPILRPGDIGAGDWKNIEEDICTWSKTMAEKEDSEKKKRPKQVAKPTEDIEIEVDENLPPVRSGSVNLEGNKQKVAPEKKNKRVMPRDYREWDKVDVDKELEKVDNEEKKQVKSKKANLNGVSLDVDATGLSKEQKEIKATREKDKGNEAFRSSDFEESVTYYSRSISLSPLPASYNNRALAYLKLEKWDQAIKDCNCVLNLEADNIKALLRRGTAYKSKKDFNKAISDFERVLKMEPQNKKAEGLLDDVMKEKKQKGRRMVIEEVDDDEQEDADEAIEVEKPAHVVNGFGNHKEQTEKIVEIFDDELKKSPKKSSNTKTEEKNRKNASAKKAPVSPTPPVASSKDPAPKDSLKSSKTATPTTTQCSTPTSEEPVTPPSTSDSAFSSTESQPSTPVVEANTIKPEAQQPATSPDTSSKSESSPSDTQTTDDSKNDIKIEGPEPTFTRPQFLQQKLDEATASLKQQGNELFRSGQYGQAIDVYTKALAKLEKDPSQTVNVALLLSNRAACQLKTGQCGAAVGDCARALDLVPHQPKPLLRRAAANEALEKYGAAYVDYKHVLSLDLQALQAHQGASRCQSMLQQRHGGNWRAKLPPLVHVHPWEVPLITDPANPQPAPAAPAPPTPTPSSVSESASKSSASQPPSEPSPAPLPHPAPSQPPPLRKEPEPTTTTAPKPKAPTKEENFEAMKTKGNQYVQKGEYSEAAACYSRCIALCPDQVACFTNRALCLLKLGKNTEAESDCVSALALQPNNPKALYRRALARKALGNNKGSLQDLVELLKLEPRNTAAKKEMEAVKQCYKEELVKLKAKVPEQENKVRKRMKIEEVDDDEEDEKPARAKNNDKAKAAGKGRPKLQPTGPRGGKGSASSPRRPNAERNGGVSHSPPVAPPIAPRLMKTTPYEFCQAWNSLKPCQGVQPYAEILRQVAPADLPSVISNKLDGQMLQTIVRCVSQEMVLKGDIEQGYKVLHHLCQVPRFSTVSMFMTSKEKKEVSGLLDIMAQSAGAAFTPADITQLRKEYSVK